jgi:uncharacterized LabA/DUF88 family protein
MHGASHLFPEEPKMIRAYIDYQNTYRLLKDREGFCLLSLKMGSLIAELIESVGETSSPTHRAFSGIHSEDVDRESRARRLKQFCALRHQEGISVFARDYAYRKNADGYLQSREKGIDVRLGCELVAAAAKGDIDGALIWSADQDLSEAIAVAKEVAAAAGRQFTFYGVEIEGMQPVSGAIPVKLTRTLLYRHLRCDEAVEETA